MTEEKRSTTPLDLLERMLFIRRFDERLASVAASEEMAGTVMHSSMGQEATAVAVGCIRRDGDLLFSTHRGVAHCLAWGVDATAVLAECAGRIGGLGGGLGGHMHLFDPATGLLGTNGVVGAGAPQAVGAAYALSLQQPGGVAICFLGDGAANTGACLEALNLAVAWALPVLFVCEDNEFAEMTYSAAMTGGSVAERAAAFGLATASVDGNDVLAVYDGAARLLDQARDGQPAFLYCKTLRVLGHYIGDPQHYRVEMYGEEHAVTDPLAIVESRLGDEDALSADSVAAIEERVDAIFDEVMARPRPTEADILDRGGWA